MGSVCRSKNNHRTAQRGPLTQVRAPQRRRTQAGGTIRFPERDGFEQFGQALLRLKQIGRETDAALQEMGIGE
jgi:hypothetical protein